MPEWTSSYDAYKLRYPPRYDDPDFRCRGCGREAGAHGDDVVCFGYEECQHEDRDDFGVCLGCRDDSEACCDSGAKGHGGKCWLED